MRKLRLQRMPPREKVYPKGAEWPDGGLWAMEGEFSADWTVWEFSVSRRWESSSST